MKTGSDKDGCGRTPGSACSTLLYLLQQVNRTHHPPSTELRIATDKSLTIDQQAAVSTILFYCLSNQNSLAGDLDQIVVVSLLANIDNMVSKFVQLYQALLEVPMKKIAL